METVNVAESYFSFKIISLISLKVLYCHAWMKLLMHLYSLMLNTHIILFTRCWCYLYCSKQVQLL